jgi:plastocyanin
MEITPAQRTTRQQLALRLAGAALLAATGGIHLDLYLTSYRHIPTIGWLFLLQVIAAFALAAAVAVTGSPLIAAAGAGFAIATLGGYLLSLWIGLFGFHEVRTTAGIVAGVIEVAAFAVLAILALAPAAGGGPDQLGGRLPGAGALLARLAALSQARRVQAGRAVAGLAAVALVVLGVSVAGAGGNSGSPSASQSAPPGSGSVLKIVIKNFQFSPATPKAAPGQRIEVTNEDSVAHTLSAGPAAKFASAFNTGNIAPGQAVFITAPTQPGGYPFYCKLHTFMTGMLVVGNSSASAAALSSFRAAVLAHPPSYCGRKPAAGAPAVRTVARRTAAGRPSGGD